MKKIDRIKLDFTRNWKLPGKQRLSNLLKPSPKAGSDLKNGLTWLTNEDVAIFTTADNYIEWSLLSGGTYEDEINKLIRISLKSGDTALDIGANIGLQSIRMGQAVGSRGKVYSFEPLNYLQEKFTRNIGLNRLSQITLFPFALSDEEGQTDYTTSENSWNQGTFSLGGDIGSGKKQQVIIKVGDNLPEIQALDRLDLIKIDVEGFELHVIKGLGEAITRHRPRIIFEYDENYWKANGQQIGECFDILSQLNYQVYQITSVGCELIGDRAQVRGGNLFCIPQ